MDLQHFITWSGAVTPEQSTTYAARAVTTSTTKIVRPNRIHFTLNANGIQVKHCAEL
jgi:hypothetical protein